MMTDSFSQLLQNIQRSDPKESVHQIWELFREVNHMKQEEIIATYQTLRFFQASVQNVDARTGEQLAHIDRAIQVSMCGLCFEAEKRQYAGSMESYHLAGFLLSITDYPDDVFARWHVSRR